MRKVSWIACSLAVLATALVSTGAAVATSGPGCDDDFFADDEDAKKSKPTQWLRQPNGLYYYNGNAYLDQPFSVLKFDDDDDDDDRIRRYALSYFGLGGGGVSIILKDGDLEAFHAGKKVPEDRIEREDGKIRILDEEGEVIAELEEIEGRIVMPRGGTLTIPGIHSFGSFNKRFGTKKPIIGVHLGQVSEALAAHLDVDRRDVVMITQVLEDYPAEKAGLKAYDVITHIEGEAPATSARLNEVLADKEPGDEIDLTILRDGRERDVRVEVTEMQTDSPFGFSFERPDVQWPRLRERFFEPRKRSDETFRLLNVPRARFRAEEDRMEKLEKRLEHLEELLEKLLDRQKKI